MTSDTKSGEREFSDAQLLTTVILSRNAVVAPRVVSSPTLLKDLAKHQQAARRTGATRAAREHAN